MKSFLVDLTFALGMKIGMRPHGEYLARPRLITSVAVCKQSKNDDQRKNADTHFSSQVACLTLISFGMWRLLAPN